MPSVTHDGQSFALDGRRLWLVGASLEYARIPDALWPQRIAAVRQAGFNTVVISCPWMLHEPRRDRFDFDGPNNVRRFVELCGSAGLRVALRPGPAIGNGFDGGGLPGWLSDIPDLVLREANGPFLERVSLYFRKLFAELADLNITNGGPITLVQSEHAWLCSNPEQAEKYLREITRMIRESGVNVPVINANDLWQESTGTIDTWRGWDDLLVNLRQLRRVQPSAPRVVSSFDVAVPTIWGGEPPPRRGPDAVLRHMAQILAAGAQPFVSPFHGGTNFGFLAGRRSHDADSFLTTAAGICAPLGEAGARGPTYLALKRLATFANHFGHVFAELDPDDHVITIDMGADSFAGDDTIVLPLRGSAGRVAFVFRGGDEGATRARSRPTTLVLEDGVRMPIDLGDQPVGWYVFDVDLNGSGRLDYCNLCPHAIVDRAILVVHGPEKSRAFLAIDDSPLEAVVPGGQKPAVINHKGVTVVICNPAQIDATYFTDTTVFVGCSGLDDAGNPIPAEGFSKVTAISKGAQVKSMTPHAPEGGGHRTVTLGSWEARSGAAHADGSSPRYATLEGPEPLTRCGAPSGYGWYRVNFPSSSAHKAQVLWPDGGDRFHIFHEGKLARLVGVGPGAEHGPFNLNIGSGEQTLVILADNFGRFSEASHVAQPRGIAGDLHEVKPLSKIKPKTAQAKPVHPFDIRGFILGGTYDQLSAGTQLLWTFEHGRKTPLVVDVDNCAVNGTFVLNDKPLAYHGGATTGCVSRLFIKAEGRESLLKRGKNVLRFAPELAGVDRLPELAAATTMYECVRPLAEDGAWAFAKWQAPGASEFQAVTAAQAKAQRGTPCWWRTTFESPRHVAASDALWLDAAGLSKGQAFVNGHNLGRYFTATGKGKAVGPQSRLYVPGVWLAPDGRNEVMIFDEHGFDPRKVRLSFNERGDLDER